MQQSNYWLMLEILVVFFSFYALILLLFSDDETYQSK